MKRLSIRKILAATALTAFSAQLQAAFHLWEINEVYSNADGTLQFVELFSASSGQQFLADHTMTASSTASGESTVFTFPSNSSSPTNNKTLLIATEDFQAVTGISVDYVIPNGYLPIDGGTLNFSGVDTLNLDNIPTDGTQSLSGVSAISSATPTNFNGETGGIPSTDVVFDAENASLEIGFISASGLGSYQASLALVPGDALTFDLVSAELLTESIVNNLASVDLESGIMTLPRVIVGENIYSATLQLDSSVPGLRFVLVDAELLE